MGASSDALGRGDAPPRHRDTEGGRRGEASGIGDWALVGPVPLTSPLVSALDANAETRRVRGEAERGVGDEEEGTVPLTSPLVSASCKGGRLPAALAESSSAAGARSSPPPFPTGEVAESARPEGVFVRGVWCIPRQVAVRRTPSDCRGLQPPPPLETGEGKVDGLAGLEDDRMAQVWPALAIVVGSYIDLRRSCGEVGGMSAATDGI
jgi:hypothetical protein